MGSSRRIHRLLVGAVVTACSGGGGTGAPFGDGSADASFESAGHGPDGWSWPDASTGGAGGAAALTCGQLAQQSGWNGALCEWNDNGVCNGRGTPTPDCDLCCSADAGAGGGAGSGGTGNAGGGAGIGAGGAGAVTGGGFGYPVGDKTTSPAGGWTVWQILGVYWDAYGGRHLAQDVSVPGGVGAVDAPVYSVADGVVRYAKPNTSAYKNVLLIEHDVGDGSKVCSFYGHINPPTVSIGEHVTRGQQVATVLDWADTGGGSDNSHLHYVLLSEALCAKAAATGAGGGSGICGYDHGGPNGLNRTSLADEPYYYTAVNDDCGSHTVSDGFVSPTRFIDDHHF